MKNIVNVEDSLLKFCRMHHVLECVGEMAYRLALLKGCLGHKILRQQSMRKVNEAE